MTTSVAGFFGKGAVTDFSDPQHPKLIIDLSDLENTAQGGDISDGTGLSNIATLTAGNIDQNADRIFAGLVKRLLLVQPDSNSDPTLGVYVVAQANNPSTVTRGAVRQLSYAYVLTAYASTIIGDLTLDSI